MLAWESGKICLFRISQPRSAAARVGETDYDEISENKLCGSPGTAEKQVLDLTEDDCIYIYITRDSQLKFQELIYLKRKPSTYIQQQVDSLRIYIMHK